MWMDDFSVKKLTWILSSLRVDYFGDFCEDAGVQKILKVEDWRLFWRFLEDMKILRET